MKRVFILLFFTFVLFSISCTSSDEKSKTSQEIINSIPQEKVLPTQKDVSNHINWFDFEQGIEKAEAEGKDIIIDFYIDWCKWCKVMDDSTFSALEVIQYINENYVAIRVNAEDSNEYVIFKEQTFNLQKLTSAFGVKGFPTYAFLNEKAQIITLVPSYIEKGMFLNILKYIHKKCYERQISFEDFLKEDSGCEEK